MPFFTCGFTLSGLNLERFMNTLQKESIPLVSARRVDIRTLRCECYTADLPAIQALAQEKGWSLRDITPLGFSAFIAQIRARPGVLIGAVLALAAMLIASQFIWRIDVYGAEAYKADIAAFLKEEGLYIGMPKTAVNAAELEDALTRRYPKIAWFQVYVYHVTLVVDCTQGVPLPELPKAEPGDMVAGRDGVVESVRVFAGTPLVKAGDIVRKGQVLIEGRERGQDEQWSPVHARGVVNARCWRTVKVELPIYDLVSAETGETVSQSLICTPWFSIPSQPQTPAYLGYNTYITLRPVVGAFFPVYQKTLEWREVAMEYALRDVKQVEAEAVNAAFQKLENALRAYDIIDKWVDYCMIEGSSLAVSATAEWQMDISENVP